MKIDMQGLRKSGAMYKLRLSDNDYQAVQLESGHNTPVVLMQHYNEVMDVEKSSLARKLENDFYAGRERKEEGSKGEVEKLLEAVMPDSEKLKLLSSLVAMQNR